MVLQRNLADLWGKIPEKTQLMASLAVVESKELLRSHAALLSDSSTQLENQVLNKNLLFPGRISREGRVGRHFQRVKVAGHSRTSLHRHSRRFV